MEKKQDLISKILRKKRPRQRKKKDDTYPVSHTRFPDNRPRRFNEITEEWARVTFNLLKIGVGIIVILMILGAALG